MITSVGSHTVQMAKDYRASDLRAAADYRLPRGARPSTPADEPKRRPFGFLGGLAGHAARLTLRHP